MTWCCIQKLSIISDVRFLICTDAVAGGQAPSLEYSQTSRHQVQDKTDPARTTV
jgi:hypothetical protein